MDSNRCWQRVGRTAAGSIFENIARPSLRIVIVTITRLGSNPKLASGWDAAFSGKKAAAKKETAPASKKAAEKKAPAKKAKGKK